MLRLTPEQRSIRARLAALSQHAQGKTNTGPAHQAFLDRFEREVDPEGILPDPERQRRALAARRAYFQRLALRSSIARARQAGRR